jgi:hypothetical protein
LKLLSLVLGTGAGIAAAAAAVPPPVAAAPAPLAAPTPPMPPGAPTPGAGSAAAVGPQHPTKQQLDFFEGKIRPVLAANCYKCHSVAEGKAKGNLLLDTREGWQKGGDTGTAIVPGNPEKSLLITAISYADADLQMPPNGKKLTAGEIADLTAWVKMGAPDPRSAAGAKLTGLTDKARSHWAYQPIANPAIPAVKTAGWVKTPVDAFVLAKLEASGMKPNHPAAREALIRRASYDLVGLPPTPEEVRAFQNDQSPNAFEKVIDRMLASPQYGERWGRFWLDSARYSDTSGIENLNRGGDYRYAHAWVYRDYVVKSFNQDKPYDQFLKEQIAADLLPTAKSDPDSLAALGFITVGKRFANPNDQIDERIDTLGKSTMAMTVACARCHDHKFDPIPTADYYSLHGIFNSVTEPTDKPLVSPAPSGPDFEEFKKELASIEAKNRDQYFKIIDDKNSEFVKKAGAYMRAGYFYRGNDVAQTLERNKIIAEHKLDRDLYQGLRIAPKRDDSLFLPFFKFAALKPEEYKTQAAEVLASITSGKLHGTNVEGVAYGKAAKGKPKDQPKVAKDVPVNALVIEAFKAVKPEQIKSLADVSDIYGKLFASLAEKQKAFLKANRDAKSPEIAGFTEAEIELMNFPMKVHPACNLDTAGLATAIGDLKLANGGYNRFNGFAAVNELMLTHPGSPARAMIVQDMPRARDSAIMIRGEAQNRGPVVPRRFLEIVAGKDRKAYAEGSGRLELAQDIASPKNPLTARVAINRIWAHHFGEGFVRTLDDMGVMCDPPSHPELLDYLSSRFIADGWSYKKMHKLIMLSATYQQSSDTNLTYANKDPDNRMLWRANLRRLDFEAARDTMLLYTGKLDKSIGGKPVNLTDEPYSYRRSVYGYVDRGQMPELMQQFDFPDADMANSKRTSTIVPQQALFFMNSPMSADVARKVTSRPEFVNAKDDLGRVKALYEVLFQRAPKANEVALAKDYIAMAQAAAPEVASKKAMQSGKVRVVENKGKYGNQKSAIKNSGEMVDRKPLNAWEQFAQALLMTNEIVYVN